MERKEIVYIIPANAKRSQLILGYFRPIDLGIFLAGVCLTLLLLVVIPGNNFELVLIKLIPAGIATFLVIPLPNYHNVLVLIREIFLFFTERRVYGWKGWCFTSEFTDKNRR